MYCYLIVAHFNIPNLVKAHCPQSLIQEALHWPETSSRTSKLFALGCSILDIANAISPPAGFKGKRLYVQQMPFFIFFLSFFSPIYCVSCSVPKGQAYSCNCAVKLDRSLYQRKRQTAVWSMYVSSKAFFDSLRNVRKQNNNKTKQILWLSFFLLFFKIKEEV